MDATLISSIVMFGGYLLSMYFPKYKSINIRKDSPLEQSEELFEGL